MDNSWYYLAMENFFNKVKSEDATPLTNQYDNLKDNYPKDLGDGFSFFYKDRDISTWSNFEALNKEEPSIDE